MEKDENIREQPLKSEQAQESIVDFEEKSGATTSQQEGSQFGKFSCAEDLVNAYNNLQAEFTRKCQKLSEIQKQIAEKEIEETSLKDETKEISPAFMQEDWRSRVSEFLQKNERASEFSREISNEILQDKNLQTSPNMLEIAYGRVLAKKYKTPDQIASESSFMEKYVLSNEDVRRKIFGSYLSQIQKAPHVIGAEIKGGVSLLPKKSKPETLNEAKILAEKFLNN